MPKRLAAFLFVILAAASAHAGISRYPYLQPTEDLSTSVAVMWQTDAKSGGAVKFGEKDTSEQSVDATWDGTSPRGKQRYWAVMKGLKPGTAYQYKVVSDGEESGVHSFTTSSDAEDFSFRALLISDTHFNSGAQTPSWKAKFSNLLPELLAFKPQLTLHMGDFVVKVADDASYEAGFRTAKELWASSLLAPVAGNHDTPGFNDKQLDIHLFAEEFRLPANGPSPVDPAHAWMKTLFSSFNYGRVHFVTVGAGYLTFADAAVKDGRRWLQADLDAAIAGGKVANIVARSHVPGPPDDTLLRANAALYLAGHVHIWARLAPCLPGMPVSLGLARETYANNWAGTVPIILPSTVYVVKDIPKYPGAVVAPVVGYAEMTVSRGGRRIEITAYAKDNPDLSGPRRQIDHVVIERSLLKADAAPDSAGPKKETP